MLFTSAIFLFLFLPIVLLIYYSAPDRFKNVVLLIVSLFFYTWGESVLVWIMIATLLIDFTSARIIARGWRRLGLAISVVSNLSMLGFFKYFNFALENYTRFMIMLGASEESLGTYPSIVLPLGISFYTFQSLSYTIDVYRGEVKANRNLIDFAAFVTVFPQLVAGPIVRYADVESQFRSKHISLENFTEGVRRFVFGLSKKMLIANPCAAMADLIFGVPAVELSTIWTWAGVLAYTAQIFYDFSGYSDMAIGLGKMLGFDFLENFNYPYVSRSIREFWQRWHISLSTWFRDYLYIPLGGSRHGQWITYRNLLIVFCATGLWHGASWNFVFWGLFHGAFLVLERLGFGRILTRIPSWLSWSYAFVVVCVGWVFFRVDTLSQGFDILSRMFIWSSGEASRSSYLRFFFLEPLYGLVLFLAVAFATPWRPEWVNRVKVTVPERFRLGLEACVVLSMLLICCAFIAADSYNPFIYFRF